MEEIAKRAHKLGFRPKTVTTDWTMNDLLGKTKLREPIINETCKKLLLFEIQQWLIDWHDFEIWVEPFDDRMCRAYANHLSATDDICYNMLQPNYTEALKLAVRESLEYLEEKL